MGECRWGHMGSCVANGLAHLRAACGGLGSVAHPKNVKSLPYELSLPYTLMSLPWVS